MSLSLAEAKLLLEQGMSPSRAKAEKMAARSDARTGLGVVEPQRFLDPVRTARA